MTTKQRILDSALRLLQSRSYAGFSFQDIAVEVGIRKASIYSHFASKEALAKAVLEQTRRSIEDEIATCDQRSAINQLEHYLGLFRRLSAGGERLCPGGSFAAVWSATTPGLQLAAREFTNFQLELIERIIKQGRAEGAFKLNELTPGQHATLIMSSIQGALLMARITGKNRVLDIAIDRIKSELST